MQRAKRLTVLLPLLAGCLGIDDLRELATEPKAQSCPRDAGSCECEGTPADIKMWKLHLGQSDYVTLKNLGECSVELGGLQVFLDDLSQLFPDFEVDCPIALPPFTLQPGAEVRVHEHPLEGDIDGPGNAVSGCGTGLSFNPERGGAAYLCDGPCDQDHVLDMIAFDGEDFGAPPSRFRQTFDAPLSGVTLDTQESVHFRRIAVQGEAPSFLASDWGLELRYLYASFDESIGIELEGESVAWETESGERATIASTSDATIGAAALRIVHRGNDGRSQGLAIELVLGQNKPSHISWFSRIDALPASAGFVDLSSAGLSAVQAGFEDQSLGIEIENGARVDELVSASRFHQVELRNLDWDAHRYDLYIDRALVQTNVPFKTNAFFTDRISLYSISSGSSADWDEIEAWR